MAYTILVDPAADEAILALPPQVRPALDEVVTVIGLVPWNGKPINQRNPDGALHQLVFGPGGHGILTYLILEDLQRM